MKLLLFTILHNELQAKLDAAWIASAGDLTDTGHVQSGGGLPKRRSVREVETLGAELQALVLGDRKSLGERQVEVSQSGSEQDIAAGVAVGILRLNDERTGVEPAVDALL